MRIPTLATRKRFGALALTVLIALPVSLTAFPRPAHALFGIGDIVHDPIAYIKDFGLDHIGWVIAKTAIASMQRSLVNWINTGFEGSPAFATDLRYNMTRLSDGIVAMTVAEIAGDVTDGLMINSPYQDEIATAIRTGYYLSTGGSFYVRNPYTLNYYSNDPLAFLAGDFSQGGFPALHAAVTNCQNNPYCAYQLAEREVAERTSAAGGQLLNELNWGDGFLSYRGNCTPIANAQQAVTALNEVDNCIGQGIRTPGSVIASQLNQTLPKGMEGLVTADEIDEVIGALLQQLVTQVVGSTGLLGVSAPSSGGGRPYIDRATDPNQQTQAPATIDPVVASRLTAYESSWNAINAIAEPAARKCPESSLANQAFRDSLTALARVDAARRALSQQGASVELLGDIMPTSAEVIDAQNKASDGGGSLKQQLAVIAVARGCPNS